MKFYKHMVWSGIFVCLFIWIVIMVAQADLGPLSFASFFISSAPDIDQKMKQRDIKTGKLVKGKHRHYIWHSAFFPTLIFLSGFLHWNFAGVGEVCFAVGLHLICDYKLPWKGKQSGLYCIWLSRRNRMSARGTNQYLFTNALICIVLALISLIL